VIVTRRSTLTISEVVDGDLLGRWVPGPRGGDCWYSDDHHDIQRPHLTAFEFCSIRRHLTYTSDIGMRHARNEVTTMRMRDSGGSKGLASTSLTPGSLRRCHPATDNFLFGFMDCDTRQHTNKTLFDESIRGLHLESEGTRRFASGFLIDSIAF
jgi:hypothetical protein